MSAAIEVKYFNTFILKKINQTVGVQNPIWDGSFGIPSDIIGGYPAQPAIPDSAENYVIEESRIRGGFNNTSTDYGAKAYLVEELSLIHI